MDSIIEFLTKDILPIEVKEAEKVRRVAAWFWLSRDQRLYRRSFRVPSLSCLHPSKVNDLLTELHEGVCGSHVGGHSLAHCTMPQGFWWLRMQRDASKYMKGCEQCQKHAPIIHKPAGSLNPISNPWPFARWRLDIIGPFP